MYLLSLESSTSSAKAMLFCLETGSIEQLTEEYHTNGDEQDAEEVFQQTAALGKRLCAGRDVALVTLCSAWHSVFLCDESMRPVTPVQHWTSTAAAELCVAKRRDSDYVRDYYSRSGCMVNATYPAFKLMHLRETGHDVAHRYVFGQGSYNTYRLTGERVVTDCMVSGSGLLNVHTRHYDERTLAEIGITRHNLGRLIPYSETVALSEEGARLLGLRPGTPVIAACSDGGLNQVGVGAHEPGVMSFSVGTSAAMRLSVATPRIPETPSTWCYLSPLSWMIGAASAGACNCVSWYKDNYFPDQGYPEVEAVCDERWDNPVFLPFLFGERCPGWRDDRKGIFAEISPAHDKYDLFRAVLEGVLFGLYHCFGLLSQLSGVARPRIILSGGILHSKVWTQMCADVFGLDLEIPQHEQSSLVGGIVLGLKQLGREELARPLLASNRVIRCDATRHERYQTKYQTYRDWYERTK